MINDYVRYYDAWSAIWKSVGFFILIVMSVRLSVGLVAVLYCFFALLSALCYDLCLFCDLAGFSCFFLFNYFFYLGCYKLSASRPGSLSSIFSKYCKIQSIVLAIGRLCLLKSWQNRF